MNRCFCLSKFKQVNAFCLKELLAWTLDFLCLFWPLVTQPLKKLGSQIVCNITPFFPIVPIYLLHISGPMREIQMNFENDKIIIWYPPLEQYLRTPLYDQSKISFWKAISWKPAWLQLNAQVCNLISIY